MFWVIVIFLVWGFCAAGGYYFNGLFSADNLSGTAIMVGLGLFLGYLAINDA
jgi:hypothetical protein